MDIKETSAIVTGGASGLGQATAWALADGGAHVVVVDLPGTDAGETLGHPSGRITFAEADVTDPQQVAAAIGEAEELGPFRVVVHCAGRGGPVRLIDKTGEPGNFELFQSIVHTNLAGSFNVASQAAARMARQESVDGERGVIVMTASVAAFEGQIGQAGYAASKAGVHGFTICAARDLASKQIRVCTIAPGLFATPMLNKLKPEILDGLGASVPHPSRLGQPSEYAMLAMSIVGNPMLNGETIRLDGAIRMAPR
ncbi:SDR family NAD(P)-dependent oxidoreductase [Rhodococcus sp. IEGM 1381]|uniref:SDR family NAD(P)-dependent oxidoreductase n=1 Tax=Rhodococcus sp. IEGM 1381 TaxID=3047085 RepID=UPI0024B7E5EC|nr:SDR family NAD(P)-dependent oxidoreductase [Rhodococcus sp. IEGM 1381]MDI9894441.1 SDR family NAD(P)-dependent oxidoreductase [Rhodococcus sp. IEGM 1381]